MSRDEEELAPTPNIDRLIEVLTKADPRANVFWNTEGDYLIIDSHFGAANLEAALGRWVDDVRGGS